MKPRPKAAVCRKRSFYAISPCKPSATGTPWPAAYAAVAFFAALNNLLLLAVLPRASAKPGIPQATPQLARHQPKEKYYGK